MKYLIAIIFIRGPSSFHYCYTLRNDIAHKYQDKIKQDNIEVLSSVSCAQVAEFKWSLRPCYVEKRIQICCGLVDAKTNSSRETKT